MIRPTVFGLARRFRIIVPRWGAARHRQMNFSKRSGRKPPAASRVLFGVRRSSPLWIEVVAASHDQNPKRRRTPHSKKDRPSGSQARPEACHSVAGILPQTGRRCPLGQRSQQCERFRRGGIPALLWVGDVTAIASNILQRPCRVCFGKLILAKVLSPSSIQPCFRNPRARDGHADHRVCEKPGQCLLPISTGCIPAVSGGGRASARVAAMAAGVVVAAMAATAAWPHGRYHPATPLAQPLAAFDVACRRGFPALRF
jgi:hypothetical protein